MRTNVSLKHYQMDSFASVSVDAVGCDEGMEGMTKEGKRWSFDGGGGGEDDDDDKDASDGWAVCNMGFFII